MDIIREIAILPFPKPDNYHGTLSKWVKDGYFSVLVTMFLAMVKIRNKYAERANILDKNL